MYYLLYDITLVLKYSQEADKLLFQLEKTLQFSRTHSFTEIYVVE